MCEDAWRIGFNFALLVDVLHAVLPRLVRVYYTLHLLICNFNSFVRYRAFYISSCSDYFCSSRLLHVITNHYGFHFPLLRVQV